MNPRSPSLATNMSRELMLRESSWLSQAEKRRSARSSRRSSCGTTSFGSSPRVPQNLRGPIGRPLRFKLAMTRMRPSARGTTFSMMTSRSASVIFDFLRPPPEIVAIGEMRRLSRRMSAM